MPLLVGAMSYGDRASGLKKETKTEAELLASTVQSLAQAEDTTNRVLTTLHGQTEQLHRIQADAEAINHNLDRSEWLLRSLKPWGWVRNIFRKDPQARPLDERVSSSSAAAPAPAPAGYPEASRGAQRLLAEDAARKANAPGQQLTRPDLRDPHEKTYDQIDNMLEGLLVKSQQINHTLGHHNQLIPEIAESVERDQARIAKQKAEMKKRIG